MPTGTERLCPYCYGTGRYERVRACGCQTDGVCDNARLAHRMGARVYRPSECDGWITVIEFCDCPAGQPEAAQ